MSPIGDDVSQDRKVGHGLFSRLGWRGTLVAIVAVVTIGGSAIILTGGLPWPVCWTEDCWTVEADAVDYTDSARTTVAGQFIVRKAAFGTEGVPSDWIGGACLVANLNPEWPKAVTPFCTSNTDCNDSKTTQRLPDGAGWYGYCHKSTGRCWVRPGPQSDPTLCHLSVRFNPDGSPVRGPDGKVVIEFFGQDVPYTSNLPYAVKGLSQTKDRDMAFRIVACLNGKYDYKHETATEDDDRAPCSFDENDNRVEVFGKHLTVLIPAE